ncbi:hypothetical protein FQA45_12930 [Glutamicibacter halophytocola]|uniref:Saposin B type region 2 domain-containing protein n=1 Tax=Glutamicibacter halophytocola TaxID=1933880 RepID=A0ABX5YBT2_9MICC|nr:hypothetical protein [Glutamicibacter halophytocola]QDY67141.1 hypothetical protein FQA45_12930 [Glutamicibacter halophytocola]
MDLAEIQNYIDVYGNMIVQFIQQDLDPAEILSMLGLG